MTDDLSTKNHDLRSCPDFDWSTDDAVIITEQPMTAIYWNCRSQLIIRQRCWPDDDTFIFFNRAHLPRLIAMLQAEAEAES